MVRKNQTKVTSAVPEPVANVKRENIKAADFFSIYANDVQVQTSPWDMRLVLGEIASPGTADEPVISIKQLGELRISPQLAKQLTVIMLEQLTAYEARFGNIPVPKR